MPLTQLKAADSLLVDGLLPHAIRVAIELEAAKFPPERKRSVVIAALRMVQKANGGSLTNELMDAVADYLELPRIAVYEVATFYVMFDLKPVGKYKIYLCTNISCLLTGSEQIADHLKAKLGVEFGQTTADGKFTLKEAECLAACGAAPACQIDLRYYENLTPDKIDAILDNLD